MRAGARLEKPRLWQRVEPGMESEDGGRRMTSPHPRWLWPSVAAGVLALVCVVALGVGVFRIKTKNGVIVLENVPDGAVIEVDGERITVTRVEGQPVKIEVQNGKHGVVVRRGDDVLLGESVILGSGKSQALKVRSIPGNPPEPRPNSHVTLEVSPRTRAILDALEKPVPMSFGDDTPLEDVLKYVKEATRGSIKSGIPIYVDPIGLQEAEKSMTSTVRIDLKSSPLKDTLRLLLDQLDLAYVVKDDVLMIISQVGTAKASKRAHQPWRPIPSQGPSW